MAKKFDSVEVRTQKAVEELQNIAGEAYARGETNSIYASPEMMRVVAEKYEVDTWAVEGVYLDWIGNC